MDYSREIHEASFYDSGDYEPDHDELRRELADEEQDSYEVRRSIYRCTDMSCGAQDCARCYPASFDAIPAENIEPEEEQ